MIQAPHNAKYTLMLERIQKKLTTILYSRLYRENPFYVLSYPTLFIIAMVHGNDEKNCSYHVNFKIIAC